MSFGFYGFTFFLKTEFQVFVGLVFIVACLSNKYSHHLTKSHHVFLSYSVLTLFLSVCLKVLGLSKNEQQRVHNTGASLTLFSALGVQQSTEPSNEITAGIATVFGISVLF